MPQRTPEDPDEWEELRDKLESEGGVEALLSWGGPKAFPAEAQALAEAVDTALGNLRTVLTTHGIYN